MGRLRMTRRTALLTVATVADLLLIVMWATRPAFLYFPRLGFGPGFVGDPNDPPLNALHSWLSDELTPSPVTPTGFLLVFPPLDLLILAALLCALVLLTIVLTMAKPPRTLEGAAAGRPRVGRFRVRTALVAIALVGLYLGWELDSWRRWELRRRYVTLAHGHAGSVAMNSEYLRGLRARLARLDAPPEGRPTDARTPEARAADQKATRDFARPQIAHYEAMIAAYTRLKNKYEHAASDPLRPVDPDPPLPRGPDLWPFATDWREPALALAAYNEQVQRYPALTEALERRAWILATCADARLRDGKTAVASATRACELTNWKDLNAVKTLAAAYAEAGDFPRAVEWQQKVLERCATAKPEGKYKQESLQWLEECLSLYRAGKPYRGARSYLGIIID